MDMVNKIVMLPLDERPCNYEFPKKLSFNGEINLVLPKKEMLGNKKTPANSDEIEKFLLAECDSAYALIVSLEMLVYGGLLYSRLHFMDLETVEKRLGILKTIKERNKNIKIYAFSLIMRCPSYSSSEEEPDYYEECGEQIHNLGRLTHKFKLSLINEQNFQAEEKALKAKIFEPHLKDYLSRRDFNVGVNIKAVELTSTVIDFLVIPQDDSAEYGYTAMNQAVVRETIRKNGRALIVFMYPGADEVGLTLLARAVNELNSRCPKVFIRYAAESAASVIPCYEDRPLGETLKYHILAAGGVVTSCAESADLILAVSCPSCDMAEASCQGARLHGYNINRNLTEFVFRTVREVEEGKAVTICDNAYANGADLELLEMLNGAKLLPQLAGYAGWNTSSNTAGTALFQGMMYLFYGKTKKHLNFLAERVVEDAGYCSLVRGIVSNGYIKENGLGYFLADGTNGGAAKAVEKELKLFLNGLGNFGKCVRLNKVSLPWNRMFEVFIDAEYFGEVE